MQAGTEFDVVLLAFLVAPNPASLNFANKNVMASNINNCQSYGKKVLLSIGGQTGSFSSITNPEAAKKAATTLWNAFGPQTSNQTRSFGSAAVNGFNLDFETPFPSQSTFAKQLASLLKSEESPRYYLTVAPLCHAYQSSLFSDDLQVDAIMPQFYNKGCKIQSSYATWDRVASSQSAKVLLGLPGGPTAATHGYLSGENLRRGIEFGQKYSSFGGVAFWDASQVWANNSYF